MQRRNNAHDQEKLLSIRKACDLIFQRPSIDSRCRWTNLSSRQGNRGYRVSPRRYSGIGSNKFVALNNAQETIEEQSMSYRAGTERDSGDDYRAAKVDRDRSASTDLSRVGVNAPRRYK